MNINPNAPPKTADAARKLAGGIENILRPSDKTLNIVRPEWEISMFKKGVYSADDPFLQVAEDPELIVVIVGTHPQTTPLKSRKARTPQTKP